MNRFNEGLIWIYVYDFMLFYLLTKTGKFTLQWCNSGCDMNGYISLEKDAITHEITWLNSADY